MIEQCKAYLCAGLVVHELGNAVVIRDDVAICIPNDAAANALQLLLAATHLVVGEGNHALGGGREDVLRQSLVHKRSLCIHGVTQRGSIEGAKGREP